MAVEVSVEPKIEAYMVPNYKRDNRSAMTCSEAKSYLTSLWRSMPKPEFIFRGGGCIGMSVSTMLYVRNKMRLERECIPLQFQAGSAGWKALNASDKQDYWFEYVFEPESVATIRNAQSGLLPELHVWLVAICSDGALVFDPSYEYIKRSADFAREQFQKTGENHPVLEFPYLKPNCGPLLHYNLRGQPSLHPENAYYVPDIDATMLAFSFWYGMYIKEDRKLFNACYEMGINDCDALNQVAPLPVISPSNYRKPPCQFLRFKSIYEAVRNSVEKSKEKK